MPSLESPNPAEDPACCWLSAHLYFRGEVYGPSCDRVIVEVAEPFVRQCEALHWCRRHFFVRYADAQGPHVRLRLYGEQTTLERKVKGSLLHFVPDHLPADLRPPEQVAPVQWIAYEPETERYGGPEGVAVAEDFFHDSSEAAFALLRPIVGQPQAARLGKGLLSTLVLLQSFLDEPESVAALCYKYATGYLESRITDARMRAAWTEAFDAGFTRQAEHLGGVVEAVWEALEAGAALNEPLDTFRRGLLSVKSRLFDLQEAGQLRFDGWAPPSLRQAFLMLVPNYLHMTNNRLGITIPEEAYLAHLIRHTLLRPVTPSLS